jgi:hypothetical protein
MWIYVDLLMVSDALLILCGAVMYWWCPKMKRSWLLGYGSARSMTSDAAWRAGNRFAGQTLSVLALIFLSIHVVSLGSILTNQAVQTVSVLSVLCLPFAVMYLTERHLSRMLGS